MKQTILLVTIVFLKSCLYGQRRPEMPTGYINFPRNNKDVEINRDVERRWPNIAPLFGGLPKTASQKKTDSIFIAEVLTGLNITRDSASKVFSDKGWGLFFDGDSETASKRFNQAYLLDSNNYSLYWGFGAILGRQRRWDESIEHFKQAIRRKNLKDTEFANLCIDYSIPLRNKFTDSGDKRFLDSSIAVLIRSDAVAPERARTHRQLAVTYAEGHLFKDALESYRKMAEIDPRLKDDKLLKEISRGLKEER